jgi:hypothetical protein
MTSAHSSGRLVRALDALWQHSCLLGWLWHGIRLYSVAGWRGPRIGRIGRRGSAGHICWLPAAWLALAVASIF